MTGNDRPPSRTPATDLDLAAAVHDVNQMLSVVCGRAGLLLERLDDPESRKHLQAILLATGDAGDILRRISGVAPPTDGPVALAAGLRHEAEQARLLVWPAADDSPRWSNEIAADLGAALPPQVLREVLSNLLLNALAVLPSGGSVAVSATAAAGRVRLQVADDGPGLPAGDTERLFERGVSGSGQSGRGIGLAGCRQLLANWGGTITARNGEGGGAVFALELPAGPVPRQSRPAPVATDDGTAVPSMRVLIVDDESSVREMLAEVVTAWGGQVQVCRDAQAALAEFVPGTAAVALIDRNLPGISGTELARRLRDSDPCLSIVIVTGWQAADELAGEAAGVVDLRARKPLALPRLRDILNMGYQLNQTRRAAAARDR